MRRLTTLLKYVIICADKSDVTYYGQIGIEAFFCSYCRSAKAGTFCVDGFMLMKLRLFTVRSVVIILALLVPEQWAQAGGSIAGQGRFEKIAGVPSMGYQYLYEWDLFLSPSDNSRWDLAAVLERHPGKHPSATAPTVLIICRPVYIRCM